MQDELRESQLVGTESGVVGDEAGGLEAGGFKSGEPETGAVEAGAVESGGGLGPRLVVKRSGAETDLVFGFAPPAVIGRFDPTVGPIDVDLGDLEEGVYVSRKHAKVVHSEDGGYAVVDLGSSNGTFVLREGEFVRVEGEAAIGDGDEIALGNARFVFRV